MLSLSPALTLDAENRLKKAQWILMTHQNKAGVALPVCFFYTVPFVDLVYATAVAYAGLALVLPKCNVVILASN